MKNTLANGKMTNVMVVELKYLVPINMSVNGKMINVMAKELNIKRMAVYTPVNGRMVKFMVRLK
jgi:hypothetical protein